MLELVAIPGFLRMRLLLSEDCWSFLSGKDEPDEAGETSALPHDTRTTPVR